MLIIRDAQLQAFIAADDEELVAVVAKAVRKANPTRVDGYSDEKLGKMVRIAVDRARNRGISKVEYIAAFSAIMFETSPRFDEQKDISNVLNDVNHSPEERVLQLFTRVPEEAWAEAERSYDEAFWFAAS